MTLKTLADVRELMRHLPADRRNRTTWRHVAAELEHAGRRRRCGRQSTVALRVVMILEGVECRP
jgi:hypothetical protein